MEILKTATDWAKAEAFSLRFFILFGLMFLVIAIGFWQLGKTEVARAFIYPTLVAGVFLVVAGIGLTTSHKARLSNLEANYKADASGFVKTEIARVEKTIEEYQNIALKVFPAVIAVAGLLIIFVDKPIWRAICMTTIAMLLCMIWIDSIAKSRLENYHRELVTLEKKN